MIVNFKTRIPNIEGATLLHLLSTLPGLTFYNKDNIYKEVVVCTEEGLMYKLINEEIVSDCSEKGLEDMNWYFKGNSMLRTKKNAEGFYDLDITSIEYPNEYLIIRNLNMNFIKAIKDKIYFYGYECTLIKKEGK